MPPYRRGNKPRCFTGGSGEWFDAVRARTSVVNIEA
jgi:hypothetical protein